LFTFFGPAVNLMVFSGKFFFGGRRNSGLATEEGESVLEFYFQ